LQPQLDLLQPSNFLEFALKYQTGKSGILKQRNQDKKFVVITFPSFSSNPLSPTLNSYCKYALIKYSRWDLFRKSYFLSETQDFRQDWKQLVEAPENQHFGFGLDVLTRSRILAARADDLLSISTGSGLDIGNEEEDWCDALMVPEGYIPDLDKPLDLGFNWSNHRVAEYTPEQLTEAPSFVRNAKSAGLATDVITLNEIQPVEAGSSYNSDPASSLNTMQRKWFDLVLEHCSSNTQLLLIVLGSAGTGNLHNQQNMSSP
jgi:hypothetical protein